MGVLARSRGKGAQTEVMALPFAPQCPHSCRYMEPKAEAEPARRSSNGVGTYFLSAKGSAGGGKMLPQAWEGTK
jgi:hypothetical protein